MKQSIFGGSLTKLSILGEAFHETSDFRGVSDGFLEHLPKMDTS